MVTVVFGILWRPNGQNKRYAYTLIGSADSHDAGKAVAMTEVDSIHDDQPTTPKKSPKKTGKKSGAKKTAKKARAKRVEPTSDDEMHSVDTKGTGMSDYEDHIPPRRSYTEEDHIEEINV